MKSDSGMMGGSILHEFMLLTPVGEDSIAICSECGFSANMEVAESIVENSCGANEVNYHYIGLDLSRELPDIEYHDFAKIKDDGICPVCGKPGISVSRGIVVGNIFQLGTKYTKSMK